MTFGESVLYNEALLNVIEKCNAEKQAIRKLNRQLRSHLKKEGFN